MIDILILWVKLPWHKEISKRERKNGRFWDKDGSQNYSTIFLRNLLFESSSKGSLWVPKST